MVRTTAVAILAVYALIATWGLLALKQHSDELRERVLRAESLLQGDLESNAAPASPTAGRTFRARNGVVLNAADLEKLDERRRETQRMAAEIEYILSDTPVPDVSGRK